MPLADLGRCKRYLKIPPGWEVEDELVAELLASATAMVLTFIATAFNELSLTGATPGAWSAVVSLRRGGNTIGTAGTVTTITLPDLETLPEYSDRIEPVLNQNIVDVVAHLYKNRSPNASSESEGGGISESWDDVGESGLPKRVERRLQTLVATLSAAA